MTGRRDLLLAVGTTAGLAPRRTAAAFTTAQRAPVVREVVADTARLGHDLAGVAARMDRIEKAVSMFEKAEALLHDVGAFALLTARDERAIKDVLLSARRVAAELTPFEQRLVTLKVVQELKALARNGPRRLGAAARLPAEVRRGYVSRVVSAAREVVQCGLDPITEAVIAVREEARLTRSSGGLTEVVDSHIRGSVEMPTLPSSAAERTVRLGTDRLVGVGVREPLLVRFTADGPSLPIAGRLRPRIGVEAKARENAGEGLEQLVALVRGRGDRYVIVGGEIWIVDEGPAEALQGFLVALAGAPLDRARTAARGLPFPVSVLPLPADLEAETQALGEVLVDTVTAAFARMPRPSPRR